MNEYAVKKLEYLNKLRHLDLSMFTEAKHTHLHVSSNPNRFLSSLMGGYLPNFFEEILVCNISHLGELIDKTYRLIEVLENGKQVLKAKSAVE